MTTEKSAEPYSLYPDQRDWLDAMVAQYHLADRDKALRILIEHARHDADPAAIFETVRCHHCG